MHRLDMADVFGEEDVVVEEEGMEGVEGEEGRVPASSAEAAHAFFGAGASAFGGGGGGSGEEEAWEFHPLDDDSVEGMEDEFTDDPTFCFLCVCQDARGSAKTNPRLERVRAHLQERYHLQTRRSLALMTQTLYNDECRPHTHLKKVWPLRQILAHVEHHVPTQWVQLVSQRRVLSAALRDLEGQLRQVEKKTGKVRIHKAHMQLYLQLTERLRSVQEGISKLPAPGGAAMR